MAELIERPGLEGVVAARTRLSHVDGERGELVIAGFPLADLAGKVGFEELVHLLWEGHLPTAGERDALRRELASARVLPRATVEVLRAAAAAGAAPMDALRMGASTLDLSPSNGDREQAVRIVAALPTVLAVYARLAAGKEIVEPDPSLSHAANLLWMLDGERPTAARATALDTYLVTVADHGLNASTFAARVIVSTGSGVVDAVVGAIGALKGPLHGGAPGPALELVREIGSADRAESVIRARLAAGERLMGFGHRIYRVRDPRADVLGAACERLFAAGEGVPELVALAKQVEETALRVLREHRPDRALATNVEFYTALLLDSVGIPTPLFTPVFACGRAAGWTAHCLEQRQANRLIRPTSIYVGPALPGRTSAGGGGRADAPIESAFPQGNG
jgi:citrate synthase